VEKSLLVRSGLSPEDDIAVRKPAKPANDIGVNCRPLQSVRIAACARKFDAALLVGKILGMLERQIEKPPFRHCKVLIKSARDGAIYNGSRLRIGGKATHRAAEYVTWKLIEHDCQRQRTERRFFPRAKMTSGCGLVSRQKSRPDFIVEGRIFFEPFV